MLHGVDWLQRTARQLAQPQGGQQTAANALDTLAARLAAPESDLQTRKAAVLSIKGLARDHLALTSTKALPALSSILQNHCAKAVTPPPTAARLSPEVQTWKELDDIARAALETIIILCDPSSSPKSAPGISLQSADIFLTNPESLHALLPLLAPQHSFYTRFATLQLLSLLLRARPAAVQAHTLSAPGGYAAILNCLAPASDSAANGNTSAELSGGGGVEIVRNEALLLLPLLVHANPDVQKLVAFEGAFERLLDVIALEGRIEGGLIVQDALEGIESLLTNNVSNQNYFRETLSIPMLAPLLFYPPPLPPQARGDRMAEADRTRQLDAFCFQQWDEQKILNARLVVGIGALLVGGQGEGKRLNQNAMASSGFTSALIHLALSSTAPPSLQSEALHTLASLFRASRTNQDLIASFEEIAPVVLVPSSHEQGPGAPPTWNRQAPRSVTLALLSLALYGPPSPSSTIQAPKSEAPFYAIMPDLDTPAAAAAAASAVNPSSQGPPGANPSAATPQTASEKDPNTALLAQYVWKGPFFHLKLRAAALAAFEALVADNVSLRLAIVQSMVNVSEGASTAAGAAVTPGSLLLDALVKLPEFTSATVPPTLASSAPDASKPIDPYVTWIACTIMADLVRGSTTVKALARNVVFNVEGKAEWRDASIVESLVSPPSAAADNKSSAADAGANKDTKANGSGDDEEEDDERPSLIQSLIGTLTSALRLQSDASRQDRASITLGGLAVGHLSPTAAWARVCVGLITLLSVWCWDSSGDVRELLSESSNVQVLVQAALGGGSTSSSSGTGSGGGSTLSEPMLQSLAAYLLGIAYEFDTDPGQIAVDRPTLYGILKARIGEDEFGTRVRKLKEDRRFASVGPDVLKVVGDVSGPAGGGAVKGGAGSSAAGAAGAGAGGLSSLAQLEAGADSFVLALASGSGAVGPGAADVPVAPALLASAAGGLADEEWDGLWFDWPFVEAWKNNYVLIQKSILVDPASSSASQASSSAEYQDALRQVEMLRDQVSKLTREAEASSKALAEERAERRVADSTANGERDRALEERAQLEAEVRRLQEELVRRHEETQREVAQGQGAQQAAHAEEVARLQAEVERVRAEGGQEVGRLNAELERARGEGSGQISAVQQELERVRAESSAEIARLKEELAQVRQSGSAASSATATAIASAEEARDQSRAEAAQLQAEVRRLLEEVAKAKREKEEVQGVNEKAVARSADEVAQLKEELSKAKAEAAAAASSASASEGKKKDAGEGGLWKSKYEEASARTTELEKENEDLLVLLEELTTKRKADKAKLRAKGEEVSEDEEDEDDGADHGGDVD
ncbi:Vesicle-mediated ER to Golgi transport protein [Tilletia horrida]|uniref:Vesicle-mediated ER to Golgi transport protein n=1 Tax=Tilletia horrida TaxID=155126 RepID=A0AAN6JR92_9BASI|nr:Vesicle-mediated ER to Golgi transport protein [Tilletia horrida]KAK0549711.1 Vesicle-mediated ER to Golgi transport protein [Tilletia horrida]KAK0569936.1 Vesicle-mediated ER to Golgi transport protein [Tilletia horrida]